MPDILHKQGDTFLAACAYVDAAGDPVPLTGVEVTSAVRDGCRPYGLAVTLADQATAPGQYQVEGDGCWPVGSLAWDIQYVRDGIVFSSETRTICVAPDVTP